MTEMPPSDTLKYEEELSRLDESRAKLLREVVSAGRLDRAIGMAAVLAGVVLLLFSVPRIWIEGGERVIGATLGCALVPIGLHICWRPLPKNALYYRVLALEAEIRIISDRIAEEGTVLQPREPV